MNDNDDKIIQKITNYIHDERLFSVFQASKVLTHMGLSYEDLYSKSYESIQKRLDLYKEKTPIFSYYIIKNILFFHFNDFIEWFIKDNGHTFQLNKDNIDRFINFIREHYQKSDMVHTMNDLRTWFLKQENNQRADKKPLYTLRMTLHQL